MSNSTKGAGFTLIEILVAATILATLAGGVALSLNPIAQINKSQDAQKISDLQGIKTALDLYYSDHKCYPTSTTGLPFGGEWRENETVYMKKVPQDPKCREDGTGSCYRYRTETGNACPQWNVVFAQLSTTSTMTNVCAISSLSNCAPEGYADHQWACAMSGGVNCDNLSLSSISGGSVESISPTATPTPAPSSTPTPTPTPPDGSVTYYFGHSAGANPDIYEATVMPLYQQVGGGQAIRVLADDTAANITSMKLILYSDGDAREFTMSRKSGTAQSGTWEVAWSVTDTYNQVPGKIYGYDIIGTDAANNTSTESIRVQ